MGMDDADVTVENVADDAGEIVHPKQLVNETPAFLLQLYYFGVETIQLYGWFILFAVISIYFLYSRIRPHITRWLGRREQDQALHRYDSDSVYRRQEAMDAARRRMQEQHDAQAAVFAEEQRKKEEEKRKEKIADWDRHVEGKGYKSKYRPPADEHTTDSVPKPSSSSSSSSTKKKSVYRSSDYNPLTGEGAGGGRASFRPRGGASGGGG